MVRRVEDDPDAESSARFDPEGSTLPPRPELASTDATVPGGTVDRDERLGEAIEAYLEQAEGSVPPDPETFAADYPDLGDDLLAALEGLALVKGLVGGPGGPGHRLEEGRRVAGYRIVRELGRGGMGVVYEAVHVALDRPVALKVLGSQAAPDSSGRRRFLNEARTAAGLHHTHIVPVFDVGQVGGLCYYAMQRIEGCGLDRVLRALRRDRTIASGSTQGSTLNPGKPGQGTAGSPAPRTETEPLAPPGPPTLGDETLSWKGGGPAGGPLSGDGGRWRLGADPDRDDGPGFAPPRGASYYRWVADAGRQAAEALAHAHQRGIIHRDIKPSNLLVDARGMIWVADFGLARRLADPSQTQVDSLLGTPRYMSPEQARTGAIDGRADVYSLGATLYELITLRPPFDGQTAAELIDQIASREPSRPRKFDPRVPLDLETILLKALAKRPDDRYAGASALADDLGRFLAHEPVRARRIGPVGRAWRFARRHPGASAVSALAASVVLTTATLAYVRVVLERDRADQAAKLAQREKARLDVSNRRLQATMLELYEKTATNTLLSSAANRRFNGLELVRHAAQLTVQMKPDPARQVRLRDQALAFLTLRDVVALPPITTPDGPRFGLTFGPGGQRLAALSPNGKLGIWDVARQTAVDASRHPIAPARTEPRDAGNRGGPGGSRGVILGERIAMAGDQFVVVQPDGAGVRWFDVASPDEDPDEWPIKEQQIAVVLSARDGRRFVTAGRSGGGDTTRPDPRIEQDEPRVCLWDRDHPDGPRATLTIPPPRTEAPFRSWGLMLAIAPDGSRIVAARTNDPEVLIWDGDGQPLTPITLARNATALALGPAGMLAVAGNGRDVALWDLSEILPQPMPSLDLHQSPINLLRFDPRDGSMLAAAGPGGGVELWDLSTHAPIAALNTTQVVADLAFSPDGRTLAVSQASTAAGQAPSIALWSVVEPSAQFVLPESGDTPSALAFGPGDLLAIASREAGSRYAPLQFWGGFGQCPPPIVSWPDHRPATVGFDTKGQMIVPDSDALRWFRPPGQVPVREVAWQAADAAPGTRPRPRGDQPPPPPGPGLPWGGSATRLLARTADGDSLLLTRSNSLYFWSAADPETLTRLETVDRGDRNDRNDRLGGFGRGPSFALAPGGTTLYHLARQGEVLIARRIGAGKLHPPTWSVPVSQASWLCLSTDGQTLAFGSQSGKVELRGVVDGSLRGILDDPQANTRAVESLAFSPDSQTLAIGGREQVRLWAVGASPRPLVRLAGHRGSVRNLAFDAKGVRLAGADEKAIKVWDLAKLRQELGRLGLDW